MADLHALGQGRGTRGVLQKGDVVRLQRGRLPGIGQGRVQAIDGQQPRHSFATQGVQALQRVTQGCNGQQQAWFGIVDDRQQACLMVRAAGLRWIGRHRDHAGIQAAEERRHIVRPAGEQQHGTVTERRLGLQGRRDGAGARIEITVAEHGLGVRFVRQEAQRDAVRGLRSARLQGLDQREREFEGVRHGVSCHVWVIGGERPPREQAQVSGDRDVHKGRMDR